WSAAGPNPEWHIAIPNRTLHRPQSRPISSFFRPRVGRFFALQDAGQPTAVGDVTAIELPTLFLFPRSAREHACRRSASRAEEGRAAQIKRTDNDAERRDGHSHAERGNESARDSRE